MPPNPALLRRLTMMLGLAFIIGFGLPSPSAQAAITKAYQQKGANPVAPGVTHGWG
jgi:hypothetical protein